VPALDQSSISQALHTSFTPPSMICTSDCHAANGGANCWLALSALLIFQNTPDFDQKT
jgi:hypothetical protein